MNTNYEAIILAKSDKLLGADTWVDKPMLKLGTITLLEYQIRWLLKNGIKHIIIASDKEWNVRDALWDFITWSIEPYGKGTGGAVMLAIDKLKDSKLPFYVMNVDDVCFYNPIQALFPETQAKIVVSKPRVAYGVVKLRQELVIGFREKPYIDDYVSCGHYAFKKHIVEQYFPDNGNLEDKALSELSDQRILFNHRVNRWIAVNTYKDYMMLQDTIEQTQ